MRPLTKIDITRYRVTDPGVVWLTSNGFRIRFDGQRVFAVREG